ncbi:bifunctional 2-polyprenyl-6-hydroxyphenol methylase/3-demethylubiquinol 3-O-methyltransferase UbiG [Methylococcus geothermalis]|uniref:Ubiquinone biosynthesis O-methyltransferase n=1 Tax=Methylococcus geothermalis TaxID=2681310 RepID=A0A858QC10_9GAMM|nr:bifunctional 2-polyprenyl-6-hydroxyphenol methylase/3-demethylubiquinol 3-O-methyltransferase UbiG [Methylococcus geothermalis]QJD31234.1 bifunctional 2-polyprenyl-6-hydroxyphenol methylase/3-demethylubiquinol 3-O-methyltransferase UbiG [Methylococcus geothermalis]
MNDPFAASIDPAEIERFERLAGSKTSGAEAWWNPEGPFWPLHRLNALRLDFIRGRLLEQFGRSPAAPRPLAGLDILDIGCGGGLLSEALAALGARVHGVDAAERNIEIARRHAAGRALDIQYQTGTAESLAAHGRDYDAVMNLEVVEHVADLPAFMQACCRLVRPGGCMVVSTINRTWVSYVAAIVGAEYLLRWLPRGTHQWRKFRTPAELHDLLECGGLEIRETTGVGMLPIARRPFLTPFRGVNYMLLAARP